MKLKFALACFSCISLFGASPKCLYLESPGYIGGAGMFHNFNIVLGCLELYDKNQQLSFEINFKDQGLYYNQACGLNWWSYYFEQSSYPARQLSYKRSAIKCLKDEEKAELGNGIYFYGIRQHIAELINKYIRVKKPILDEVDAFIKRYFQKATIIGVHYRGSDKWLESNYISYAAAIEVIKQHVQESEVKLFVATDELGFLEAMQETFGDKVIYTASQRSGEHKPLHYTCSDGYLQGKEALVDCLLLSKCHLLIRTNSNLSAVSAFFNPHVKIVNLNTISSKFYKGLSQKGTLNELNQVTFSQ